MTETIPRSCVIRREGSPIVYVGRMGIRGSEQAVRSYVHVAKKRLGLDVKDVFILLEP